MDSVDMEQGPPAAWSWSEREGPARLRSELERDGIALFHLDDPGAARAASWSPWAFAERLLGRGQIYMVEQQPIRPLPGGRSFACSDEPTPLHSDSQLFCGVPPHAQIMLCVQPAERGGESLLLDTWPLLSALASSDRALLQRLFEVPRRIPFVFGEVIGPAVSWRGGSLVFTHSPQSVPGDAEAAVVQQWLARTPPRALPIRAGEIMVIHNHRVLHGRRAFADTRREFVRLLVWCKTPFPAPPTLGSYAEQVARRNAASSADATPAHRRACGLATPPPADESARLALVLAMLRGVPPGLLAAQSGVPEPELYRYRDAALAAAAGALSDPALERDLGQGNGKSSGRGGRS